MNKAMVEENNSMRLYFEDISSSQPLSRDREVELAQRIQDGDEEARDELVKANLRFVVDVAKNYQNRGLDLSDLISAGNLGLLTAAERFDGTKGYKFISYAVWWIRQSILQSIAEQGRLVRLPFNKLGLLREISRLVQKDRSEREPSFEEIAQKLNVPLRDVFDTLTTAKPPHSLDDTDQEEDRPSLLGALSDPDQPPTDSSMWRSWAKNQLSNVLDTLHEREQYVLRLYFGLNSNRELTLEEIGDLMGVTRERVRQIKKRSLEKLNHPSRSHMLQALSEDM
jgi:RNA polymerase primary sigma factor